MFTRCALDATELANRSAERISNRLTASANYIMKIFRLSYSSKQSMKYSRGKRVHSKPLTTWVGSCAALLVLGFSARSQLRLLHSYAARFWQPSRCTSIISKRMRIFITKVVPMLHPIEPDEAALDICFQPNTYRHYLPTLCPDFASDCTV